MGLGTLLNLLIVTLPFFVLAVDSVHSCLSCPSFTFIFAQYLRAISFISIVLVVEFVDLIAIPSIL